MANTRQADIKPQLDKLINEGFDLQAEAISLAKRVEKLPFDDMGIPEPLRKCGNCLAIGLAFIELARQIQARCQLQELKAVTEKLVREQASSESPMSPKNY